MTTTSDRRVPSARYVPDEHGEDALRHLARTAEDRRIPDLWKVSGHLHLDLGGPEPLRLGCTTPIRHALEPLTELANFAATGRAGLLNRALGTAGIGRASHLYYRWRGEHDAIVILGDKDTTLGVDANDDELSFTVLETDDQPHLEDLTLRLTREQAVALPVMLWDDLDALLAMLEIDLDARERARWERLRPNPESAAAR